MLYFANEANFEYHLSIFHRCLVSNKYLHHFVRTILGPALFCFWRIPYHLSWFIWRFMHYQHFSFHSFNIKSCLKLGGKNIFPCNTDGKALDKDGRYLSWTEIQARTKWTLIMGIFWSQFESTEFSSTFEQPISVFYNLLRWCPLIDHW